MERTLSLFTRFRRIESSIARFETFTTIACEAILPLQFVAATEIR